MGEKRTELTKCPWSTGASIYSVVCRAALVLVGPVSTLTLY